MPARTQGANILRVANVEASADKGYNTGEPKPSHAEPALRPLIILLLLGHALLVAQAQPSDALASAWRAATPFIEPATPPHATLLRGVTTTALGCELVAGLPLAQALDAWRFDFPTVAGDFSVHTSVDGGLAQLCDERVPNLGFGPIPLAPPDNDLALAQDACWLRATSDGLNVRVAPGEDVAAKIDRLQTHKALGTNADGDWLFYREGWVKRSLLRLTGSCADLPVIDPQEAASGVIHFCPAGYAGFLPPRISIGRRTAQSASQTFANRLRASPQPDAPLIAEIPPRQIVDHVLDGPACQGTYVWWQVAVDGQVGWTVESDSNANFYYLEPYATPSLRPLAPAAQPGQLVDWSGGQLDHPAENIDAIALADVMQPRGLAISPDRKLLAVGGAASAELFAQPPFGSQRIPTPAWLTKPIDALAWSHAGDKLALISGQELQIWKLETSQQNPLRQLDTSERILSDRFPYPLRSAAFSRDDRWLAVTGMSASGRHGAIWVYDAAGEVALSLPLAGAGLPPVVVPSPQVIPGDFAFSSADQLYALAVENAHPRAFYQLAGTQLRSLAFAVGSRGSALLALALESDGLGWVALVDALDADVPSKTLRLDAHDLAFDPIRNFLAATTNERLFYLGTVE